MSNYPETFKRCQELDAAGYNSLLTEETEDMLKHEDSATNDQLSIEMSPLHTNPPSGWTETRRTHNTS